MVGARNCCYLDKMVIWSVQVFVQLDDETFEEGRKLPLHFARVIHLRGLNTSVQHISELLSKHYSVVTKS